MEITKSNFHEQLPHVKEAIDRATFVAIDCELTGLNVNRDINGYDTQKTYYEKVRKSSKDFLVIQYGLSAFRYDADADAFKQKTYNFYIFPKSSGKYVPDQRFLCQASSIDFLVSQGFDFNKLFKEGIPYLNSPQEMNYREHLSEAQKIRVDNITSPQKNASRIISMQDQDKVFVDNITKQIEDFLSGSEEELVLPKCNSFLRLLIYQTIRLRFDDKVGVKDSKDQVLTVVKYKNSEQRLEDEKRKTEEELDELEKTIGFSKVIRYLSESGKFIVGHNICLDLLHTLDKFLTPLPDDYDEFKECTHCLFSNILDTKYMSSMEPFKELISSNVLGHLLETVCKEPFTLPSIEIEDDGCGYDLNNRKEHEAGYDAYITGVCFLAMWKYLGDKEANRQKEIFHDFGLLKPYINRLFLMRLQDSPYIHLGGKDPTPQRDHVFYLTFPKDWKLNDIMQLFSPFGPVYVSWINEHSAYVGLTKRHQAAVALSTLSQSETYGIMTYAKRQAQLAGLGTTVPLSPLPVSRKRLSDGHNSSIKKRKTLSLGETTTVYNRRSIDPISEERETAADLRCASGTFTSVQMSKKVEATKAFDEDNSWD